MAEESEQPLMSLRPSEPFQLLLWERNRSKEQAEEIKRLNLEIGMLKSELDELRAEMKTSNLGQMIIKLRKQNDTVDELRKTIKKYKSDNELLLGKIALATKNQQHGKEEEREIKKV